MNDEQPKDASEGSIGQSASTGGLGDDRRDIVERLRDTPNWLRESWGDWKSCTTKYDRAPKEAADEIERLRGLLRRGMQQIAAWQEKYGEYNPAWLPPAGDVQWMEDVSDALKTPNAIGEGPGAASCARSLSTDGLGGNGGSGNV
jgi:hypothetical protein